MNRLAGFGIFHTIEPLIMHPDLTDPDGWLIAPPPYDDTERKYVLSDSVNTKPNVKDIYYNTNKVSQAEIDSVEKWDDFLDPRWKGRIAVSIDPGDAGNQGAGVSGEIWRVLGPEFIEPFIRNMDLTFISESQPRLIADGLVLGKYDIVTFASGTTGSQIREAKTLGLPVDQVTRPFKGGSTARLVRSTAVMDRAPHPHAAQLFLNWWFSQEGQTAKQTLSLDLVNERPSVRTDVPQGVTTVILWEQRQALGPGGVTSRNSPAIIEAYEEYRAWLINLYAELGIYGF